MWNENWRFETDRFVVTFETTAEEDDPADHFEFQEDIDAVRNGDVMWFVARVLVRKNDHIVGSDYLGGCAYHNIEEFIEGHRDADPMNRNCSVRRAAKGQNTVVCHYFPSMVAEALADARRTLATC